jgi:hypothetical protein
MRVSSALVLAAALLLACAVVSSDAAAARPRHHKHHDAPSDVVGGGVAVGASDWYRKWCGGLPHYLSDQQCVKAFPSVYNRTAVSTVRVSRVPDAAEGWAQDSGNFADVKVDTTTLNQYLRDGSNVVNACVILIRRPVQGGVYFKYFCGSGDDSLPFQPWSSTKIYAQANAAGHIREVCPASGLTSDTTGKHGLTPLGDLATVVCSYDTTQGYTSNGLSKYFHDLGGRLRLLSLLQKWFGPRSSDLSLGGNYGMPTPTDLSTTLQPGACHIQNDTVHILPNRLTALAHVDILRRLCLSFDLPVGSRFPSMQPADQQTIMYGAERPLLFPGLQWGGMTTSIDIYAQTGLDMAEVERRSKGTWRIFSKMGAGWGGVTGDVVTATYAVLPVLDSATGAPVVDKGVEFLVVGRVAVAGDSSLTTADAVLQKAVGSISKAIFLGQLA